MIYLQNKSKANKMSTIIQNTSNIDESKGIFYFDLLTAMHFFCIFIYLLNV